MEENIIVIRDPKTFYFYFDWPNDVDKNVKHETEFIIKSNQSLAENKIKNKTEQLQSKYKHEIIFMNKENSKTKFVLNL